MSWMIRLLTTLIFFVSLLTTTFLYAVPPLYSAENEGSIESLNKAIKNGNIIGSVYFALSESELDYIARKELDNVATSLLKLQGHFIVRLEGFAESSREKKSAILLSIQRAQSVKLYMSNKFPELKVDFYMTGFGQTRPLVAGEGDSVETIRKKERRVDIVVYSGGSFFEEPEEMKVVSRIGSGGSTVVKKLTAPLKGFSLSAPGNVSAGEEFFVEIKVLDGKGRTIENYGEAGSDVQLVLRSSSESDRKNIEAKSFVDGIARGDVAHDQQCRGDQREAAEQAGLVADALAVGGIRNGGHRTFSGGAGAASP